MRQGHEQSDGIKTFVALNIILELERELSHKLDREPVRDLQFYCFLA
jgi:hypothetical protein